MCDTGLYVDPSFEQESPVILTRLAETSPAEIHSGDGRYFRMKYSELFEMQSFRINMNDISIDCSSQTHSVRVSVPIAYQKPNQRVQQPTDRWGRQGSYRATDPFLCMPVRVHFPATTSLPLPIRHGQASSPPLRP